MQTEAEELASCLREFCALCNANADLPKLIRKWDRYVHVQAKNLGVAFTIDVAGGTVRGVLHGVVEGRKALAVVGPARVLIEVLSGRQNPAEALIASGLEVYGAEEDVMKLDAITLVLWDW